MSQLKHPVTAQMVHDRTLGLQAPSVPLRVPGQKPSMTPVLHYWEFSVCGARSPLARAWVSRGDCPRRPSWECQAAGPPTRASLGCSPPRARTRTNARRRAHAHGSWEGARRAVLGTQGQRRAPAPGKQQARWRPRGSRRQAELI